MKWFVETYLLGARTLRDQYPIIYYSWLAMMAGILAGIVIVLTCK